MHIFSECRKSAQSSSKLADSINEASSHLRRLINNRATFHSRKSEPLEPGLKKRIASSINHFQTVLTKIEKQKDKDAINKAVTRAAAIALTNAVVPEMINVEKSLRTKNDTAALEPSLIDQLVTAFNKLLGTLIECVNKGTDVVTAITTVSKEQQSKPEARSRGQKINGIFDMFSNNVYAIVESLRIEHEECVTKCDKISDLFKLVKDKYIPAPVNESSPAHHGGDSSSQDSGSSSSQER